MPIMNIFGWYELVLMGISSVIIYFLRVRWNSPNIMFGWCDHLLMAISWAYFIKESV